jgi:pimeloyl-ACP methyl ester carboxylesterase
VLNGEAAHAALDAWLDRRFEPASAVEPLIESLSRAGLDTAGVESLLRSGRATYPEPSAPRGAISGPHPLACDHVNHEVAYLLYLPSTYDHATAWPLVVVGHGGSATRDLAFAEWAARGGMVPWRDAAEEFGLLLLAPLSDRGWGAIGNSILFSAISRVTRECHVDPDRIYLTGHSMGGHLAWRSAMNFADHWGAVSPMSGGYDYVADRQVEALVNVPGFATWGTHEPFGIRDANRSIRSWMEAHEGPWVHAEYGGGHEIFAQSIPRVAQFFMDHPRNLYRRNVRARGGGPLRFDTADAHAEWRHAHAWVPGRAIPADTFHWLRLEALPPHTPREEAVQEVVAALHDDNTFEIASVNARRLRIYLHPRMLDFSRPITASVNGAVVFRARVEPDLGIMLRLVREFDDRGRIFHAAIDLEVPEALRRGALPA